MGHPLYLKPLKLGFDMSFSSATKYFSGHSDAMGGSLAVNKKVFKQIMFFTNYLDTGCQLMKPI